MQLPKIPIKLFDNNFYNIVKTKDINFQTNIIDFVQSGPTPTSNVYSGQPLSNSLSNSNYSTISPTIVSNNITLNKLIITIITINTLNGSKIFRS